MEWSGATVCVVVMGLMLSMLQVCWLALLYRRRQRSRGAEPLSSQAFRQEIERIFRNSL